MEPVKLITWETVKAAMQGGDWLDLMDGRQQKEIDFDIVYANEYTHGTDGHNARMIIARMAAILNAISANARIE